MQLQHAKHEDTGLEGVGKGEAETSGHLIDRARRVVTCDQSIIDTPPQD